MDKVFRKCLPKNVFSDQLYRTFLKILPFSIVNQRHLAFRKIQNLIEKAFLGKHFLKTLSM